MLPCVYEENFDVTQTQSREPCENDMCIGRVWVRVGRGGVISHVIWFKTSDVSGVYLKLFHVEQLYEDGAVMRLCGVYAQKMREV